MTTGGDFADGAVCREYAGFEAAARDAERGNGGGNRSGGLDPSLFRRTIVKGRIFFSRRPFGVGGREYATFKKG